MKFIKKLISYFLKKNNKNTDDLDSIIEEVKKTKDPFIYNEKFNSKKHYG